MCVAVVFRMRVNEQCGGGGGGGGLRLLYGAHARGGLAEGEQIQEGAFACV